MDGWIARMERALALLASRLDTPPALAELAAAANVSPFHFHRIWRVMTGETVGTSITRLRIANAQQRMQHGDASVTSVAMDGGYGTPQSFARAFRRVTGMSPSEFLTNDTGSSAVTSTPDTPLRIELREGGKLVALRREGGAYRELNALFWQLWNWAESTGRLDGLSGIYGIPLDDPASVAEADLRYDACLMLDDDSVPPKPFGQVGLPSGDYALWRHDGPYDGLEASNDRLVEAVLTSGREPADFPLFHHFLDDPEEVAPEALRTDILLCLLPEDGR